MSNIIGEEIESYVANQINARQRLHGSGTNNIERTPSQLNVLNSQTSWVKLASAVSVNEKRLTEIGVNGTYAPGMSLAQNNVLYAGTAAVENNKINTRDGFLPQNPTSAYTYGEFGYVPMPGIINASIKALNRGSLKKANIKIKANDREQFEIIDLLYLRLGYTVLLEWGNSIFTPDGIQREILRNTLVDATDGFFSSAFNDKRSYLSILPKIEDYRIKWNGNYDGILGKVSNFDWTFNDDGSYDINLTVISLGDVIESLKTNISIDAGSVSFFKGIDSTSTTTSPKQDGEETSSPDPIEENKDSNQIAFMLWAWKYTNRNIQNYDVSIETPEPKTHFVGKILETEEELNYTFKTIVYITNIKGITLVPGGPPKIEYIQKEDPVNFSIEQLKTNKKISYQTLLDIKKRYEEQYKKQFDLTGVTTKIKNRLSQTSTTKNPIEYFSGDTDSAFVFKIKTKQYYLKFGSLLNFVRDRIIPAIKSNDGDGNPPIFDIDTDQYSNWMYSMPNQISLDPRVCVVRNDSFLVRNGAYTKIFTQLDPFRVDDFVTDNPNLNKAYPMNIYLNFNFILNSLSSNSDERGDVNLYSFLSSLCDGMNKALGGINNLEPVIDESTNTLKIVDTTPIPGTTKESSDVYTLQLYGYDKVKDKPEDKSNFIRKIDLKTAIDPSYATMITVGATAGGYVKGTEATAFSRWNIGLTDRFNQELIAGNPTSRKSTDTSPDEAETNYVEKILLSYQERYGLKGSLSNIENADFSDDAIERNLSIGTEYFKYLQSQNKTGGGGTVGFIPFKLNLVMDGLSGIKIYNKLHMNTRFLPKSYGNTLDFIVTGVSHELQNNDWETHIETTVIPKTTPSQTTNVTYQAITETLEKVGDDKVYPIPLSKKPIIEKIVNLAKKNNITDKERLTCILAVAGGETQWTPGKSESFQYNLARAREVFPSYIPKNDKQALTYIPSNKGGTGSPEKFANLVYGGRFGNASNEGWKYRGRGMTQITFKGNYKNVQDKLVSKYFPDKGNIVTNPDLVNDVDVSVAILVYGKINGFFGDKLVKGDKAYLTDPVRVQATQNGSNGIGKRRPSPVTPNYARAIKQIEKTPWVQDLIS